MTDPRFLPFVSPVQASHKKFWPWGAFVSVTLAQIDLEADFGKYPSGNFNLFGVKATPAQVNTGKFKTCMTREFWGGRYVAVPQNFASYDSLEEALDAHNTLLTAAWYHDCRTAQTPQEYAEALYKDHYATAPSYSRTLTEIMDQNDLYKYDMVY